MGAFSGIAEIPTMAVVLSVEGKMASVTKSYQI